MWTALFHVKYLSYFQQWNLGHKFSQVIHRSKFGIFCVGLRLYFQVFSQLQKASGIQLNFKKKLYHKSFPVNFAKFLWAPFLIEHLWRLLLQLTKRFMDFWIFFNFPQFKEKMKKYFFEYKPRLHFQISPNSLKS